MKKGFTLVELIGVVTIISIILLLIVPSITGFITKSEEKSYQIQINTIKDAAINFTLDNYSLLSSSDTFDSFTIDLKLLKDMALVDYEIKNPNTRKYFSDDTIIKLTRDNDNYNAEILPFDADSIDENVKYDDYLILTKYTGVASIDNLILLSSNGSIFGGDYTVNINSSAVTLEGYNCTDYSAIVDGDTLSVTQCISD